MLTKHDPADRAERKMGETDAETIANHMVDKLVERLSDERTVNALMAVWTKQFDQHIGQTFRRGLWILITAVAIFMAVRFEEVTSWLTRR